MYMKTQTQEANELLPIFNKTSTKQYKSAVPTADWTDPSFCVNRGIYGKGSSSSTSSVSSSSSPSRNSTSSGGPSNGTDSTGTGTAANSKAAGGSVPVGKGHDSEVGVSGHEAGHNADSKSTGAPPTT